jgi:hypothetical protein
MEGVDISVGVGGLNFVFYDLMVVGCERHFHDTNFVQPFYYRFHVTSAIVY